MNTDDDGDTANAKGKVTPKGTVASRELDRETLFDNERFIIGVLQAVSAGALIGAINQFENLWPLIGDIPYLAFLTVESVALGLAVFAAYAKHSYKIRDVKNQKDKASNWLMAMRFTITASVVAVLSGFVVFIVCAWTKSL